MSAYDEAHERSYIEGQRAAWRAQLSQALGNLIAYGAGDDPVATVTRLTLELDDTRAALREVCEEHGDNDWPDDLHLADVVEKHLAPYLDEAAEGDEG